MDVLSNKLIEFASNFLENKKAYGTAQKDNPSWGRLVEEIPRELRIQAKLSHEFIIEGSIGAGNIVEIPWVGVFDKAITKSALKGYYIVLLFKSDMSGFYLSLNQGWTQYEKRYQSKNGKWEIRKNAQKAQALLRTLGDFDSSVIDLGAKGKLGKGYELGNICSTYFSIHSLGDDSILVDRLRSLMAVYRELKGLVGTDIFQIASAASEEDYQEQTQTAHKTILPVGPIKKTEKSESKNNVAWFRNPSIAKDAIESAGYLCLFDNSHKTFISKANGMPFVEAHHLVPMEHQGTFAYSLDVPENIIPLCPICHRKIHHARAEEKTNMLKMFVDERKDGLSHRGIEVTLNQLEEMYQ